MPGCPRTTSNGNGQGFETVDEEKLGDGIEGLRLEQSTKEKEDTKAMDQTLATSGAQLSISKPGANGAIEVPPKEFSNSVRPPTKLKKGDSMTYAKVTSGTQKARKTFGNDIAARLNRLEFENQRLRSENAELQEKYGKAERENAVLFYENVSQSKKLKGANKKVEKAKVVVVKEEEKAKHAVNDKNHRLASERKMRKERNDALAAFQEQKKISGDLRAQLMVEQSGHPHLRDNGNTEDVTTLVIPVEVEIHRADFIKLNLVFESTQMKVKDQFNQFYEQWKRPEEEKPKSRDRSSRLDLRRGSKLRLASTSTMTAMN
ncbi:hypothetical protein BCR34DRAFT_661114 [Clohesyomyces aquaticus]|uniref:Uncharacterized protein n=1 Tax=Clohesyomyces aquaticus TaxID=1231657 RepID=A0A1Y2A3Q6_9PLEO|nr:hypothetical protein BCR34DRAFT_661114 [Clohesyomyces aquaticus]